jgi:hypothetical protein
MSGPSVVAATNTTAAEPAPPAVDAGPSQIRTSSTELSSAPRPSSVPLRPLDTPVIRHATGDARLDHGEPLEPPIRARLEHSFGTDLGHVRLHTGPQAAHLAAQINARSFTIGSQIGYPSATYSPHTVDGYRLLAHEVAHVTQQRPVEGAHLTTTRSGDDFERSAESAATQATRGGQIGYLPITSNILVAREGSFNPLDWIGSEIDQVKEAGYKKLIAAIRELHRAGIGKLRAYGSGLSEADRATFDGIVEAVDLTLTIFEGLIYAVISITAGFLTGIIQTVIGLIRLLAGVAEGILKFLWGFIDGGKAYDSWAAGVLKIVRAIPDGLRGYVADWKARFAKASPEDSAIMIGELTGQILAFLATLGVSAGKAGTIAQAARLEASFARAAQAVLEPATAVTTTGVALGAAAEASPQAAALANAVVKQGGAAAQATTLVAAKTAGSGSQQPSSAPDVEAPSSEEAEASKGGDLPPGYVDDALAAIDDDALVASGEPVELTNYAQAPAAKLQSGLTDTQAAHVSARSAMRIVAGYNPRAALVRLLSKAAHAGFDDYWKAVFRSMTKTSGNTISVGDYFNVMRDAIGNNPYFTTGEANSMVELLRDELYVQYGLKDADKVRLPYSP